MKNIILLFVLAFTYTISAQDVLWDRSYGGLNAERLADVIPTDDFGFILAGSSISGKNGNKQDKSFGGFDYWIWKMNESGSLDWQKSLGGDKSDMLSKVIATRDGGFLLAGTSSSKKDGLTKKGDNFGLEDYWVLKLNADGSEQWQTTLGGYANDELKTAIQLADGSFLIVGNSSSGKSGTKEENNFGNKDIWMVKINSSGKQEWEKDYGGIYIDEIQSVVEIDQELYFLGYSNSPENESKSTTALGLGDYWLFKTDKDGNSLWQKAYGGDGDDHPYNMILLKDGNLLIGGISTTENSDTKKISNTKGTDIWLFKATTDGAIIWEETYDIGEYDMIANLAENKDGSILIGGYAKSEKVGLKASDKKGVNDYVAIKIDAEGKKKWQKEIGSNGDDILTKLTKTRDGGYLLAGTSKGSISRERNTAKGQDDFWVVKLLDEENEKEDLAMLQAVPNPTDRFTNVIVNTDFADAKATLYDISGRIIQKLEVTGRTIPVDLRSLPMGVYIVQIEADDESYAVKILKKN